MTDPRVAFEAYWSCDAGELAKVTLEGHLVYSNTQTHEAWLAWEEATNAEREAAAKVCEDYGASYDNDWNRKLGVANDLKDACEECAAAIRARSAPPPPVEGQGLDG